MGPARGAAEAGESAHVASLAALELAGPARLRWLLSRGPAERTWSELATGRMPATDDAGGPPREVLAAWREEARAKPHMPAGMQRWLNALGIRVLTGDERPTSIRDDVDPSPVVFERGKELDSQVPRVAVVGTRKATSYGLRVAEQLGRILSDAGVAVVSGLALGIDGAAHRGAVAGATPAVAVIGSGHDRPCPSRNRELAARLAATGTEISEVPPGIGSAPWRYPVRNRIIAALAEVVVVVESASTGGSMSTVGEALTRDRAVMAVPGPIGRRASEGCHDLLRDGAEVCSGADDVLMVLGLRGAAPTSGERGDRREPDSVTVGRASLSAGTRSVAEMLVEGPMAMDAVMSRGGLDLATLSAAVSELERAGLVARRGGWLELTAQPS